MRTRLLVAAGLLLALLGVAASAGGAYAYFWDRSRADLIAAGVRVAGIDVGGLRASAAHQKLDRRAAAPLRRPLQLVSGSWRLELDPTRTGLRIDVARMVDDAVGASRNGSLDQRLLRSLQGRRLSTRIPLYASVSPAGLDRVVSRVSRALDRLPRSARAIPSARHLRVVPSHDGLAVERRALRTVLRRALLDPNVRRVVVPTRPVRPKVPTSLLARRLASYILVDRSHFTLRLYRHLKLVHTYRIAVGRAGLETPAGVYRISDREVNPSWHVPLSAWAGSLAGQVIPPGPADPIKARWLGFHDGAGIHGTDELSSIGTAASHGCIRMSIADVIQLYPLVPLGTPIYVG
jgi:L,D-transpeptidase catalytic domain/Putative peptidoglycan binding domain